MTEPAELRPLRWERDTLYLLEQRALPAQELWVPFRTDREVAEAIQKMVVRGAPAIGCAAAYGIALAALELASASAEEFLAGIERSCVRLRATRPTAVNLFWAIEQMRTAAIAAVAKGTVTDAVQQLVQHAVQIHEEDVARCRRMGAAGAELIPDGGTVLTHCNAGALATGGYGSALGVLRAAKEAGKQFKVLADETRPYLQGARLTAWELHRDGFDVTIIPDSAACFLMQRGEVQCVVVGADRIAANGDVANKIGTYAVALGAAANQVPFYVAAPVSTIDLSTATGDDIPIEERDGAEMFTHTGPEIAPAGVPARYPGFDVTPAALVTAIITDHGIARPPYAESLAAVVWAE